MSDLLRVLGKGKTALAIKEVFPETKLYDDTNADEYDIDSNEVTVVSPGIPPSNYLVKNTKNPISDYDLFLNPKSQTQNPLFTVWISGTNGKTTTTQMIHHLLKDKGALCGGNIGTPLASLFQIPNPKSQILILETSSFTLHYTNQAVPNIYLLLPISDDHLSWHGSFREYEAAKLKPLSMMGEDDIAIIPYKYKDIETNAVTYLYSDSDDLCRLFEIDKEEINFNEPFLTDALLALAVQRLVSDKADTDKINTFKVDNHKVEEFKDKEGNLWVDDSKATNVDATIWALKGYKDKKIFLILGGDDKGADLTPLFEELQNYDVEIFAIGTNSEKLESLSKKHKLKCKKCFDLKKAVEQIRPSLTLSTTHLALLSPAAASLDQFDSYKQRGEEFKKYVLN